MSRYNVTTYHGALPTEGARLHTGKALGVMATRLKGRDIDKPNAWSVLGPRTKSAPNSSPLAMQHPMGDVEGILKGRPSSRGKESLSSSGGQALSREQARARQPMQSVQGSI